jgi:hypothetical protein
MMAVVAEMVFSGACLLKCGGLGCIMFAMFYFDFACILI